jgi:methionine sulfoxide reductase heme-binding subunit
MTLTKFLNWTVKLACILPFFYWVAGVFLDWLGVEPLVKINTQSGYVILILLLVNLLVGAFKALNWFDIKYYQFLAVSRRYLGVMCGFYVVLHFTTYLAKESFLPKGWEQIVTKNYLIAGTLAALIILILTFTSNNISVRLMRKKWKSLHNLVHVSFVIMLFHIFLIEKANLILLALLVAPVILLQATRLTHWILKYKKTKA